MEPSRQYLNTGILETYFITYVRILILAVELKLAVSENRLKQRSIIKIYDVLLFF